MCLSKEMGTRKMREKKGREKRNWLGSDEVERIFIVYRES